MQSRLLCLISRTCFPSVPEKNHPFRLTGRCSILTLIKRAVAALAIVLHCLLVVTQQVHSPHQQKPHSLDKQNEVPGGPPSSRTRAPPMAAQSLWMLGGGSAGRQALGEHLPVWWAAEGQKHSPKMKSAQVLPQRWLAALSRYPGCCSRDTRMVSCPHIWKAKSLREPWREETAASCLIT